jgi:transposase-like protein
MSYSQEFKQRVLTHVATNGNKSQAAKVFSLARATFYIWLRQLSDHQRRKPCPKTTDKIDRDKLAQLIGKEPDLLQRQMIQIME